jgi:magnesium and cobalt transporter
MSDQSNVPSAPGSGRTEALADEPAEGQSRGFFSRIIGALSQSDAPSSATDGPFRPAATLQMPGIGNLRRKRVEDVAVPKSDIVAVPVDLTFDRLVQEFGESGLSRIPVYDGTLDAPLGMVNLKDFALRYGFNGPPTDFDLRSILRPVLYVPPSMPLAVLLQKMQADRVHMALVIDEYGGTDGLVTIEDLLETVVGEIDDEHDEAEEKNFIRERTGVWLVKATTPLEEFEAEIGMDLTANKTIDEEEVDTVGGLVFMMSGHVPERGEIVKHPDGHAFEVLDADRRRIKRLRVRLREAEEA